MQKRSEKRYLLKLLSGLISKGSLAELLVADLAEAFFFLVFLVAEGILEEAAVAGAEAEAAEEPWLARTEDARESAEGSRLGRRMEAAVRGGRGEEAGGRGAEGGGRGEDGGGRGAEGGGRGEEGGGLGEAGVRGLGLRERAREARRSERGGLW